MWISSAVTGLVFVLIFGVTAWRSRDLPRAQYERANLVVLAYDSFSSSMGPGPQLIQNFHKNCNCKVQLLGASDAGVLLEKMKLAKGNVDLDVVIGFDQLLINAARAREQWHPLEFDDIQWDPSVKPWVRADFVPFDWAPLTFIFRNGEIAPPASAADLIEPRFLNSLALQDPRTSTPGLQLLFSMPQWMRENELSDYLKKFKPNVHSVSPSWSSSYGLFQRGQAKMAFSYLTSLVYHWSVEKNPSYQAARFNEGHPVQVEYAGIPQTCKQCDLARQFVRHLLSPESQKVIMEKNFMFPVVQGVVKGTAFDELPDLPLLPAISDETAESQRAGLIETWLKSMQ